MLSEYEYAQAVMAAAGVKPSSSICGVCGCPENYHWPENWGRRCTGVQMCPCSGYKHKAIYPDPLTSGDALLALIEALRGRGLWVIATISDSNGSGYRVEIRHGFHGDGPYAWAETFQAALVEAAGQALGVSRAA